MRPLIGTSWKMNLTPTQAGVYLDVLRPLVAGITDRDLFVLPPFPAIFVARDRLAGSNVAWGGQDVHPDDWGAHTGDVSAPMLADLGCRYVEVGHSERRRDHGETPDLIAGKVGAILRWGMTPILCVGEAERRGSEAALRSVLPDLARCLEQVPARSIGSVVIAYEPVWAIGENAAAAAPEEVRAVHEGIHAWLGGGFAGGEAVRVIYGGSVDEANASLVLGQPGVDGLFVGRRALDPAAFATIARAPIAPAHEPIEAPGS
jgi:triosephosphate isomerase